MMMTDSKNATRADCLTASLRFHKKQTGTISLKTNTAARLCTTPANYAVLPTKFFPQQQHQRRLVVQSSTGHAQLRTLSLMIRRKSLA
jgi:hypothetical protein